jgi:uncharacterized membrane protein HdeD (DUF308 family)
MVDELNRSWWLFVLRGVCAVLFGILAFLWPGITIASLVLLFGAYALVNGALALGVAMQTARRSPGRGFTTLLGLLGVATGVITFFWPGITALSLLLMIAFWAIVTGVFEIAAGIRFRQISRSWMLVVSGVLSVVFGGLLVALPGAGALSVVWLIGAYATASGILIIVSAVQMKSSLNVIRHVTTGTA